MISKTQISDDIEVLLLYFDDLFGYLPFVMYPYNTISLDHERMRILGTLSLNINEKEQSRTIILEMGSKVYFIEKLEVFSKKKYKLENCAICLILPVELNTIGKELIEILKNYILKRFKYSLYQIIEAERTKYEIVQNQTKKLIILQGENLKKEILDLINFICSIFINSISNITEITSGKLQKAMAFLESMGVSVSHLEPFYQKDFSNIKLFDSVPKGREIKNIFEVSHVKINEHSEEIEILLKNKTKKMLDELNVRITHLYDLFEKEILNVDVDAWLLEEEILFAFPYHFTKNPFLITIRDILEENIIFSKKISLTELSNMN